MKFSKITLGLAFFIIISASFMRGVLNFLYRNLGRGNLQILVILLFILTGIGITYRKTWPPSRFLQDFGRQVRPTFDLRTFLTIVFFIAGFLFTLRMEIIEERIHLLEYGLLGWLAIRDAEKALKGSKIQKFLGYPLLFVVGVGILDELFQWWLPTRVGDVRDVVFNTLGGLWGIVLKILNNTSENVVA